MLRGFRNRGGRVGGGRRLRGGGGDWRGMVLVRPWDGWGGGMGGGGGG